MQLKFLWVKFWVKEYVYYSTLKCHSFLVRFAISLAIIRTLIASNILQYLIFGLIYHLPWCQVVSYYCFNLHNESGRWAFFQDFEQLYVFLYEKSAQYFA
jgi:hypothetical protein